MGAGAKMGELKRAAQQLGVTSTTLRVHGWKTASAGRIEAVKNNPPGWLIEARERRRQKRAGQCYLCDRKATASRLGIQVRAVKACDITPGEVEDLLASPPDWLVAEQERRQAQIEREAKDRLRREFASVLVGSVHEVWFLELKYATSDAEAAAIDLRWAREVEQAKREARHLVEEMTPGQVRARIGREQAAAHDAAVYRATQLARRAFGGEHG
jgi:hypothetical protein